ncbi:MAG: hypothetical protein HOW97_09110, partial [Catenulispora sp.]|nr:hypothetical protein [Catenulispora sp.]
NGTALQVGGALGVAVLGSVLAARYQGRMTGLLAGRAVPAAAHDAVTGSLGGALAVAQQAGGALGAQLTAVARAAFVDGMGLAFAIGSGVVAFAAVLVLAALPARAHAEHPGPRTRGGDRPDQGRTPLGRVGRQREGGSKSSVERSSHGTGGTP